MRTHRPLALDDSEPDIAVVTDALRDHREGAPRVRVSGRRVGHESLHHDRTVSGACTRGGVSPSTGSSPSLEVHREPDDQDAYLTVTTHGAGGTIAPIARPQARIRVQDLLPLTVERAGVGGVFRGLPPETRDRHNDSTASNSHDRRAAHPDVMKRDRLPSTEAADVSLPTCVSCHPQGAEAGQSS